MASLDAHLYEIEYMYENVCGNCVGGVELTFHICMTFHKRAFDFFISLHVDLTILKIA
jgi:hypothetical protein